MQIRIRTTAFICNGYEFMTVQHTTFYIPPTYQTRVRMVDSIGVN